MVIDLYSSPKLNYTNTRVCVLNVVVDIVTN